jgi:integrase
MAAAGIPREGPTGAKRTFHSFRHSHAKVALEGGRPITWLSRQLGHHSITVTVNTYGHFERAARRREAELMEGAFGV